MKYLSLCSGIESASVAWEPLGWKPVGFAEIEPFPSSVLSHHYPDVPNLGDITRFEEWPEEIFREADIIVGGPPCQAFSVAGLRNGLNDDRGNITLVYMRIIGHADRIRLRAGKPSVTCVYENVPGLLSDKTGAFGSLLAGLAGEDDRLEPPGKRWADAGYVCGPERAIAWRVLDAQYFALAQRRRRVFLVASAGFRPDPAAVLFERESVRRDSPPSREAGEGVAGILSSRTTAGGGLGTDFELSGGLQEVVGTLTSRMLNALGARDVEEGALLAVAADNQPIVLMGQGGSVMNTLTDGTVGTLRREMHGHEPVVAFNANAQAGQLPGASRDTSLNDGLTCSQQAAVAVAFKSGQSASARTIGAQEGIACTLEAGGGGNNRQAIATAMQVRRLTTEECEKLQGFPPGYTQVPHRGKPAADGPRYKALGNSMAVPCMAWIGRRIDMVSKLEGP